MRTCDATSHRMLRCHRRRQGLSPDGSCSATRGTTSTPSSSRSRAVSFYLYLPQGPFEHNVQFPALSCSGQGVNFTVSAAQRATMHVLRPPPASVAWSALAGTDLLRLCSQGQLLGVGGRQLQRIQQESGARVQVRDAHGNLHGAYPNPLDPQLHALITASSLVSVVVLHALPVCSRADLSARASTLLLSSPRPRPVRVLRPT